MLDTEDVIRFGSSIIGHLLGLAKFEDQWPFDCRMMPRLGPGLSIFLWPSFRKDTRPGPGPLLRAKRNPPLQLEASRLQGPQGTPKEYPSRHSRNQVRHCHWRPAHLQNRTGLVTRVAGRVVESSILFHDLFEARVFCSLQPWDELHLDCDRRPWG